MSVLVLSEDASKEAFRTVSALVKHVLLCVDSATRTHLIRFEPTDDPEARAGILANRWREGRGPQYTAMLHAVSAKLAEPNGFVFFHFDGDTTWANRNACVTREQFRRDVAEKVPLVIRMRLAMKDKRHAGRVAPTEREIEEVAAAAVGKLFALVPHYSIEAWCYQNTMAAAELCQKHHGSRHVAQFKAWASDRGALDEVYKPKENCCLGSGFNADLASRAFPRREVLSAGKSFAAAVSECQREALLLALSATAAGGVQVPGPRGAETE